MLAVEHVVVVFRRALTVFDDGLVLVFKRLSYDALFTAAEYLEGVAGIEVDGGRAPYFGILTLTTAKDVERFAKYVHTLLANNDTRVALGDFVIIIIVIDRFAIVVFLHHVEEHVVFNNRTIEIDDHIAVHTTARIAAAVDVATLEAAGKVV